MNSRFRPYASPPRVRVWKRQPEFSVGHPTDKILESFSFPCWRVPKAMLSPQRGRSRTSSDPFSTSMAAAVGSRRNPTAEPYWSSCLLPMLTIRSLRVLAVLNFCFAKSKRRKRQCGSVVLCQRRRVAGFLPKKMGKNFGKQGSSRCAGEGRRRTHSKEGPSRRKRSSIETRQARLFSNPVEECIG